MKNRNLLYQTNIKETCIVLAGGRGTRLQSITNGSNKHLSLINSIPALCFVLRPILNTTSVKKIVIVTNPKSVDHIMELIKKCRTSKEIIVRVQPVPNGTLSAVLCVIGEIESDVFSVHYGDNLFSWTSLPPIPREFSSNFQCSLYSVPIIPLAINHYGLVKSEQTHNGFRVKEVIEKSDIYKNGDGFNIITGFYRFRKKSFLELAHDVNISQRGEYELTSYISFLLEQSLLVFEIPINVDWIDYGISEEFIKSSKVISKRKVMIQ